MTTTYLTQSAVLARGWTLTMARKFLGNPDELRDNPKYRSGPPMKMYDVRRVEVVEATDAFEAAKAKAEKRRQSLRPSIEARRLATMEASRQMEIAVAGLEPSILTKQAINSYNRRWSGEKFAAEGDDPAFIERITVNYVRHQLTEYDRALCKNAGKIGVNEAVDIIRSRVYSAIAKTYPHLESECTKQAYDRGVTIDNAG